MKLRDISVHCTSSVRIRAHSWR